MVLKDAERRVYDYIKAYMKGHAYSPSYRNIQHGANISSTSMVKRHLDALQQKGYIERNPKISRTIRILDPDTERAFPSRLLAVPMLGHIAAGTPIDTPATEHPDPDNLIDIPVDMVKDTEGIYALLVKGSSMIDALIHDGDTVIMKHAQTAENGEMVAAWLVDSEETTLKRFYHEGHQIRLQPENSTMAPIYADPRNVEIHGKVVGVIRKVM